MDNRLRTVMLTLVLLASSLAGCVEEEGKEEEQDSTKDDSTPLANLLFEQAELTAFNSTHVCLDWTILNNGEANVSLGSPGENSVGVQYWLSENNILEEFDNPAGGSVASMDNAILATGDSVSSSFCGSPHVNSTALVDTILDGNTSGFVLLKVDSMDIVNESDEDDNLIAIAIEIEEENVDPIEENNTARFIYEHVEEQAGDDAVPFALHFGASPMGDNSPYQMELICSVEEGHAFDVWQGWVPLPFNQITSWKVRNSNDVVRDMFVSFEGGNATNLDNPTFIFTQNLSSTDGHEPSQLIDSDQYECQSPPPMDSDGDGVNDSDDQCPDTPIGQDVDDIGCPAFYDADEDGVQDADDDCPDTPAGDEVDDTGCTILVDTDGDGFPDEVDDFPNDANETTDSDGDGVGDNSDEFPQDPQESADSDGDGVGDNADAFPQDENESADTDGDGIGNNADSDDDGDGCSDEIDFAPLDDTECFDIDGDGIGDSTDNEPWISSSGNGSFDMNYTMIGVQRGHELYWLGSEFYAYYYSATPDLIWENGSRSKVIAHNDMPNVDAVLSLMGKGLGDLRVSSTPMDLASDSEGVEWDYDGDTKVEWRNYSASVSTLYLDGSAVFSIETSLFMYLDYTETLDSWGVDPVQMWGHSSASSMTTLVNDSEDILLQKLFSAYSVDFASGELNYSFVSQDAIISNVYAWEEAPDNATAFLEGLFIDNQTIVHGGLYDSINSTVVSNHNAGAGEGTSSARTGVDVEASREDDE